MASSPILPLLSLSDHCALQVSKDQSETFRTLPIYLVLGPFSPSLLDGIKRMNVRWHLGLRNGPKTHPNLYPCLGKTPMSNQGAQLSRLRPRLINKGREMGDEKRITRSTIAKKLDEDVKSLSMADSGPNGDGTYDSDGSVDSRDLRSSDELKEVESSDQSSESVEPDFKEKSDEELNWDTVSDEALSSDLESSAASLGRVSSASSEETDLEYEWGIETDSSDSELDSDADLEDFVEPDSQGEDDPEADWGGSQSDSGYGSESDADSLASDELDLDEVKILSDSMVDGPRSTMVPLRS